MELVTRARDRISEPATSRSSRWRRRGGSAASRPTRSPRCTKFMTEAADEQAAARSSTAPPAHTSLDYWKAGLGADDARERLDLYNRAAAHQTTADNPGLLPEQILRAGDQLHRHQPGRWSTRSARGSSRRISGRGRRSPSTPTSAAQSAGEDRARQPKMTIGKVPVTAEHLRRLRQRLPAGHRLDAAGDHGHRHQRPGRPVRDRYRGRPVRRRLTAGATAGPTIPTGAATAAAADRRVVGRPPGSSFTATRGQGRLIDGRVSPDHARVCGRRCSRRSTRPTPVLGVLRRRTFGTGAMGQITGIPVVMSAGPGRRVDARALLRARPRSTRTGSARCRSSSRRCSACRSPTPATSPSWSWRPPGSSSHQDAMTDEPDD